MAPQTDRPAHGQLTICIWGTGNFRAGICIMGNFYGLLFLIVIVGRCMIAWGLLFVLCFYEIFVLFARLSYLQICTASN